MTVRYFIRPYNDTNEKKRSERRKHCALAVARRSQKFSPRRRPPSRGRRRPKFNQLEIMVTRHYLHLQTQFGEDRCTQFWSYRGNRPTNTQTNKQTQRHDRLQYTARLSLARSVKIPCKLIRFSSACASVTYIQSVRPI